MFPEVLPCPECGGEGFYHPSWCGVGVREKAETFIRSVQKGLMEPADYAGAIREKIAGRRKAESGFTASDLLAAEIASEIDFILSERSWRERSTG